MPVSKQQCEICGASALFVNFGVLSCSSCKMFFKRHAEFQSDSVICQSNGDCEININTRRFCLACRLAKCFASGMQTILIRGSRFRKQQIKTLVSCHSQQLPTLSLLRNDRSMLTTEQWTLLSNLIHCYDEHSGSILAKRFIAEQNVLPSKFRYKFPVVSEFVTANIVQVQRIVENNGDFLSLAAHDRAILLRNTVKHTGCYGATFVLHHSRLLDDPTFSTTVESIFGLEVMSTIKPLNKTYDLDIILIKLILPILAFSTIGYTIYTDTPAIHLLDLKSIIHIQDTYIELTWRYLVHKYNEGHAIKCFTNLLRCLFNVHNTIDTANRIEQYNSMIDTIIEQTEDLRISAQ